MNLTCLQKGKFANLTANKVYEGIEDGELFIVVNDIGARARYAKKYFRVDNNAIVAAPAPPPRPATVNLLDIVNIDVDSSSDGMDIGIGFGQGTRRWTKSLDCEGTSISCGIDQISGIIGLGTSLATHVDGLPERIVNRDIPALCNRILDAILDEIADEAERAFILMSDVVNDNDPFQIALSARAITTATERNPNSGNTIRLWVLSGLVGEV